MGFLSGLLSLLVKPVLDWLASLISGLYQSYKKDKADKEAQAAQAEQDTKKASELTPESKAEEVSAAIDDELKHL